MNMTLKFSPKTTKNQNAWVRKGTRRTSSSLNYDIHTNAMRDFIKKDLHILFCKKLFIKWSLNPFFYFIKKNDGR